MKYKIKPEIQEKLDKGIPLTDDEKRSLKVATNAGTDLTLANVNSGIKSAYYSFVSSSSWLIKNTIGGLTKEGRDFWNEVEEDYDKKNEEEKERRELWHKAEVSSASDKAIGDVLSYSDILVGGVGLAGKAGKGIKAAENIAQKTQKEGFFSRLFSRSKKGAEKAKKEADDLKSKPKNRSKKQSDKKKKRSKFDAILDGIDLILSFFDSTGSSKNTPKTQEEEPLYIKPKIKKKKKFIWTPYKGKPFTYKVVRFTLDRALNLELNKVNKEAEYRTYKIKDLISNFRHILSEYLNKKNEENLEVLESIKEKPTLKAVSLGSGSGFDLPFFRRRRTKPAKDGNGVRKNKKRRNRKRRGGGKSGRWRNTRRFFRGIRHRGLNSIRNFFSLDARAEARRRLANRNNPNFKNTGKHNNPKTFSKAVIQDLKDIKTETVKRISNTVETIKKTPKNIVKSISETKNKITKSISNTVDTIKKTPKNIVKSYNNLKENLKTKYNTVKENVKAAPKNIAKSISETKKNIGDKYTTVKENIKAAPEKLKKTLQESVEKTSKFIKDAPENIAKNISETKKNISTKATEIVESLKETPSKIKEAVKNTVNPPFTPEGELKEVLDDAAKVEKELAAKAAEHEARMAKFIAEENALKLDRKNAKWYKKGYYLAQEAALAATRKTLEATQWLTDKAARAKEFAKRTVKSSEKIYKGIKFVKDNFGGAAKKFFGFKGPLRTAYKATLKGLPFVGQILGPIFALIDIASANCNMEVKNALGRGVGSFAGGVLGSIVGGMLGGVGAFILGPLGAFIGDWVGEKLSYAFLKPIDFIPYSLLENESTLEDRILALKENLKNTDVPGWARDLYAEELEKAQNTGEGLDTISVDDILFRSIGETVNKALESVTGIDINNDGAVSNYITNYTSSIAKNPKQTETMSFLVKYMDKAELSDKEKMALFALVRTETESGRSLVENTNWSWDRACQIWKTTGPNTRGGRLRAVGEARWKTLTADQKADIIYADLGGARFKGRGLVQLTGEGNYTAAQKRLSSWGVGADITNNPDLVGTDAEVAAASAVAWWCNFRKRLKPAAEKEDLSTIRRICAGGNDTSGGLQKFFNYYADLKANGVPTLESIEAATKGEVQGTEVNTEDVPQLVEGAAPSGIMSKAFNIAWRNAHSGARYSQERRTSDGYFDCSSFIARSLMEAGFPDLWKLGGGSFYTGNMNEVLAKVGFTRYSWNWDWSKAVPGDIFWVKGHTEMFTGVKGKEFMGAHSTKTGVSARDYGFTNNPGRLDPHYRWTHIFRYTKGSAPESKVEEPLKGDDGVNTAAKGSPNLDQETKEKYTEIHVRETIIMKDD